MDRKFYVEIPGTNGAVAVLRIALSMTPAMREAAALPPHNMGAQEIDNALGQYYQTILDLVGAEDGAGI